MGERHRSAELRRQEPPSGLAKFVVVPLASLTTLFRPQRHHRVTPFVV
jgi:hypothetical protein